jgi:hypothetical protein
MALTRTRVPAPPARAQGRDRFGGVAGNERLTAEAGALLFILLAALGVTVPAVRQLIYEHVFLGMLLIPPVLLKLGATGYRFLRYYTRNPAYRRAGPPTPLLRMVAPLVVATTLAVFATGVMLLVVGPSGGIWLGLHKGAFVAWFGVTSVHVLAYMWRVPRLAAPDWRRDDDRLGGSIHRRLLVGGSIAAGVVLASATVQLASAWTAFG